MNEDELKEYNMINGLETKDFGSRAVLLRAVKYLAKQRGYRVSGFNKMPRKQLFEIHKKLDQTI